jgi:lipopolysaccharide heptosyltransferase I
MRRGTASSRFRPLPRNPAASASSSPGTDGATSRCSITVADGRANSGPASFGAVAQGLAARGIVPVVTWGPGEEGLADAVVAASGKTATRCFPTTLLEYVEVARRARIVVAADTGPLHLACAVGTPVVGLFGPTDPARNGPFGADDLTVRRQPLCAPCHRRRCRVHAGVMSAIPPAEVLDAIDRRLARAASARAPALAG